jgi:hypothetical protein
MINSKQFFKPNIVRKKCFVCKQRRLMIESKSKTMFLVSQRFGFFPSFSVRLCHSLPECVGRVKSVVAVLE